MVLSRVPPGIPKGIPPEFFSGIRPKLFKRFLQWILTLFSHLISSKMYPVVSHFTQDFFRDSFRDFSIDPSWVNFWNSIGISSQHSFFDSSKGSSTDYFQESIRDFWFLLRFFHWFDQRYLPRFFLNYFFQGSFMDYFLHCFPGFLQWFSSGLFHSSFPGFLCIGISSGIPSAIFPEFGLGLSRTSPGIVPEIFCRFLQRLLHLFLSHFFDGFLSVLFSRDLKLYILRYLSGFFWFSARFSVIFPGLISELCWGFLQRSLFVGNSTRNFPGIH